MFLRELRKARGITMKELGDMLGVSESTISLYENGKREPSYELLLKIAEFFNVSVDYLLRGEDKKPVAPKGSELDELVKDELVGFYGDVKKELTPGDIEDIKTLMKIRAELNRQKGK